MTKKRFNSNSPVVLGLAGQGATGKSSEANQLVPESIVNVGRLTWDRMYFAMPLYEMATARQMIEGEYRKDRQLYAIHQIVSDLFGGNPLYGAPSYDCLIETVKAVYNTPITPDGVKPREFLQTVGTFCRELDADCFVKSMKRRVNAGMNMIEGGHYCVVIDDARMENEIQWIQDQPNGLVVKLTASTDIRNERMLARDGIGMTTEQAAHVTEQIDTVPSELFAAVIDTDYRSIEDVHKSVMEVLYNTIEGLEYA